MYTFSAVCSSTSSVEVRFALCGKCLTNIREAVALQVCDPEAGTWYGRLHGSNPRKVTFRRRAAPSDHRVGTYLANPMTCTHAIRLCCDSLATRACNESLYHPPSMLCFALALLAAWFDVHAQQ